MQDALTEGHGGGDLQKARAGATTERPVQQDPGADRLTLLSASAHLSETAAPGLTTDLATEL